MKFSKITTIHRVPSEPIYHLTVDNNHNFFGNNICLHNCDYFGNPKNEGEIYIKLHNQGEKTLRIPVGEAMAQVMFQKYLLADDDDQTVGGDRVGGIGSTSSK